MRKETELSDEQIKTAAGNWAVNVIGEEHLIRISRQVLAADRELRQGDVSMPVVGWLAEDARIVTDCTKTESMHHIARQNFNIALVKLSDAQAALVAKDVEIEGLTAERDALRKDAERYLWLRVSTDCDVYVYTESEFGNKSLQRESLDEHIDAAMVKEADK